MASLRSLNPVQPTAYKDRSVGILTQHGKEQLIGPILHDALGCSVKRIEGYDTDQLGTFTREIPRPGTQLEAARRKARIGLELSHLPLALASEGAFGSDPYSGLLPWNVELIVFIDSEHDLEIVGRAEGPCQLTHQWISNHQQLEAFTRNAALSGQHFVLRPDSEDDPRIVKGLTEWSQILAAFDQCNSQSSSGKVLVEHDLRAHCNPARRDMIRKAAQDLVKRLCSPCPACRTPGYALTGHVRGLACELCACPTREPLAEVWSCLRCGHEEHRPRMDGKLADAARCDACNP